MAIYSDEAGNLFDSNFEDVSGLTLAEDLPSNNVSGVTNPATSSGSSFWDAANKFITGAAGAAGGILKLTNGTPSSQVQPPGNKISGAGAGAANKGTTSAGKGFSWPLAVGIAAGVGLLVWLASTKKRGG